MSAGCVEYAESFGDAESVAECVMKHVRCDGNAVCRGPLFRNGPQSPASHAVVDGSGCYESEKESQASLLHLRHWTLIRSTLIWPVAISSVMRPFDCLSQRHPLPFQHLNCW